VTVFPDVVHSADDERRFTLVNVQVDPTTKVDGILMMSFELAASSCTG